MNKTQQIEAALRNNPEITTRELIELTGATRGLVHAIRTMVLGPAKTASRRVRAYYEANPTATVRQISEATGVREPTVRYALATRNTVRAGVQRTIVLTENGANYTENQSAAISNS